MILVVYHPAIKVQVNLKLKKNKWNTLAFTYEGVQSFRIFQNFVLTVLFFLNFSSLKFAVVSPWLPTDSNGIVKRTHLRQEFVVVIVAFDAVAVDGHLLAVFTYTAIYGSDNKRSTRLHLRFFLLSGTSGEICHDSSDSRSTIKPERNRMSATLPKKTRRQAKACVTVLLPAI